MRRPPRASRSRQHFPHFERNLNTGGDNFTVQEELLHHLVLGPEPGRTVARYDAMKLWYPDNRFHEPLLNQLGCRLVRHGRTGDALADHPRAELARELAARADAARDQR